MKRVNQPLEAIELSVASFRIQAADDCRLPEWLGSTVRGALGSALQKRACLRPRRECSECMLREVCAYTMLMETHRPASSEKLRAQDRIPHPFLVRPLRDGGQLRAGELLDFEIVLVGRALSAFPALVAAAEEMADHGLGSGRHKFKLLAVTDSLTGSRILWRARRSREVLAPVSQRSVVSLSPALAPAKRVRLKFTNPLRLLRKGRLQRMPAFRVLAGALLARLSSLSYFHCDSDMETRLDFKSVLAAAESVRLVGGDMRPVSLNRYSNRQGKRLRMDAVVGDLVYRGDAIRKFWPYLLAGQHVHLGKGTVFGLGRYEVDCP